MADDYYVCGVYLIFNEVTGASYIGSSHRIQYRWTQHRKDLKSRHHKNPKLQASWNKYGKDAFGFYIVEAVVNESDLLKCERHYIEKYEGNYLLNICRDPERQRRGIAHTEDTKRKVSAIHKGRKLTEEHKANIRLAMAAPDVLARIVAGHIGKKQSEDSNRKRSRTMKQTADSDAWKERCRALGLSHKGKKGQAPSPETREKLSIAVKASWHARKNRP